ncbi:hypothetical protein FA15DRAFT_704678 [Coprinopsis marcescibilis]|uniref:Uncharacterized protein n=1 Tax=Coprinopsis marcescibilis TaxID=230819 RepID=A0A5C3KVW1_COPMA|nr:hypothetical protein FA15DRAFT_704678 [Coprinopsis marcescibilis]
MKISSSLFRACVLVLTLSNAILAQDWDWEELSEREENDSPNTYQRDINSDDIAEDLFHRLQYESELAARALRPACFMVGQGCNEQQCRTAGGRQRENLKTVEAVLYATMGSQLNQGDAKREYLGRAHGHLHALSRREKGKKRAQLPDLSRTGDEREMHGFQRMDRSVGIGASRSAPTTAGGLGRGHPRRAISETPTNLSSVAAEQPIYSASESQNVNAPATQISKEVEAFLKDFDIEWLRNRFQNIGLVAAKRLEWIAGDESLLEEVIVQLAEPLGVASSCGRNLTLVDHQMLRIGFKTFNAATIGPSQQIV